VLCAVVLTGPLTADSITLPASLGIKNPTLKDLQVRESLTAVRDDVGSFGRLCVVTAGCAGRKRSLAVRGQSGHVWQQQAERDACGRWLLEDSQALGRCLRPG